MDFLRQQLVTINERLAGLSATQKMLTAALAVIVVMTLLYWGKSASTTDMVPLLPGALAGDELKNVTHALQSNNIAYETSASGQIMVPASKQGEALAEISFNGAVGQQTIDGFATMMAQTSPLDSDGKWNAHLNNYYERRFEQIIAHGKGIESVEVTITHPERNSIGRQPPAAHVYINTKQDNGVSRRQMADGAANVIASSIGIERNRVGVTIDGAAYNASSSNGTGGIESNELIALQRQWQELYSSDIRNLFDIQGLRVAVTVQVDNESAQIDESKIDPTAKLSMVQETKTEKTTSTEAASGSNDPGVMSNVPLSVKASGGATPVSGSSQEKIEEKNVVDYNRTHKWATRAPGSATVLTASVRVPHSYFVTLWKQKPSAGPPEGPDFEKFAAFELERIRTGTKTQAHVLNDTDVVATEYPDIAPTDDLVATGGPMLAAADATGAAGLKLFATGHAKDVAVGVLAIASLFMVGRMVKKSAPPMPEPILALDNDAMPMGARLAATGGAVAAKVRAAARSTLNGAEDVAGDVLEGGPVLMGQELDESVLETSQMVDQVGGFVKDNPDVAAQLLSRWMSRE